MDSSSALADLAIGFIVTFAGVGLALVVDRSRARRSSRSRDLRLIQNLFERLAGKRAFSDEPDVGLPDDPKDRERCTASVLDARRRAADLCDALTSTEVAVPALRRMEVDCLAYLNFVERTPEHYAAALIRLRDRLFEGERQLALKVPGLRPIRPGERSASTPAWLDDLKSANASLE